jgi:hypothetical protein
MVAKWIEGHGFTGYGKRVISRRVAALSGRIHCIAGMYGLKAVPFREGQFFRNLFGHR